MTGATMRKLLSIALLVALTGTAWGGDFINFPNFPTRGQGPFDKSPWWYSGLTFYAPFDDASNPLRLIKGTGPLSFTRATTATYVHPTTGLITSAASGQLRIESNGALIEGQRTNLVLQSSAFGTTWDNTNVTVDTDNTTSPDGTVNAELLTAFDANGTVIQDLGVIASAAKVFSVYLKRATGTGNIDLTLNGGTGWTTVSVTSSWARYQITATLADPDVGIRIVTSGDAVYAYGAQVEAAEFASSLIPTTTAAVTRNSDILTMPSTPIGTAEGTISIEGEIYGQTTGTMLVYNGTYPIYINGAETLVCYDGTGFKGVQVFGGVGSGTHLFGLTWKDGVGLSTSVDGNVASDTFDGTMNGNATVWLGVYEDLASYPLFGHIKNLRIWNRGFSDSELQAITTP